MNINSQDPFLVLYLLTPPSIPSRLLLLTPSHSWAPLTVGVCHTGLLPWSPQPSSETAGTLSSILIPVVFLPPWKRPVVFKFCVNFLLDGSYEDREPRERSQPQCWRGRAPALPSLEDSSGAESLISLFSLRPSPEWVWQEAFAMLNFPILEMLFESRGQEYPPYPAISLPNPVLFQRPLCLSPPSLAVPSPWDRFPATPGYGLSVKC